MMLPMLAFVFAAVGAVAGNLLPGISAFRIAGANCVSGTTEQNDCSVNNTGQVCTILVGTAHPTAFQNSCLEQNILRQP